MKRVIFGCMLAGCTAPLDAGELQNGIYEKTTTVVSDSCLYDGQPAEQPAPRQGSIQTNGALIWLTFGEPLGANAVLQSAFTLEPANDYHAHVDTNTACNHMVVDVTATGMTSTELVVQKTNDYEIRCAPDGLEPDASCTRSIEESDELLTVCPFQCVIEDPPESGQLHCCPNP